ncbi:MAG: hypothetical protein MZV70_36290 [Desulfobacterales bacterium]|nr:hypothetical protein [Desulfobacterales bacterium]
MDDLLSVLDEYAALKGKVSDQKKALDLCGYIVGPIQKERDALKAEVTQQKKDYDWMMAQHDVWKACSFKEAELKDAFKARAEKAELSVEKLWQENDRLHKAEAELAAAKGDRA